MCLPAGRRCSGCWRCLPGPLAHLPPSLPLPRPPAQALSDPAKVRHELGVALRSLEQLEQYAGLSAAGSEELAVSLKGSCD